MFIKIMTCPVCQSQTKTAFKAQVLLKYEAEYRVCDHCGYLFAIEPHWLDEAYASAIASIDTGLVKRNISISGKLANLLFFGMHERGKGRYVDLAGGYGMLTRIMRDYGFDFYWQDKYCSNLLAQGFEYIEDSSEYNAVTAFEVLEHVTNPVEFIKNAMLENGTDTIIFSTLLYGGKPPDPNEWWYYAFQTGQHIGFFQKKTLEVMARNLNMQFSSAGGIHIFSHAPINQFLFRLVTNKFLAPLLAVLVRYLKGSKTMGDHATMLNEIHHRD